MASTSAYQRPSGAGVVLFLGCLIGKHPSETPHYATDRQIACSSRLILLSSPLVSSRLVSSRSILRAGEPSATCRIGSALRLLEPHHLSCLAVFAYQSLPSMVMFDLTSERRSRNSFIRTLVAAFRRLTSHVVCRHLSPTALGPPSSPGPALFPLSAGFR